MRHNIVRAVIGERLSVCRPTVPAGRQGNHGGDLSDSGGSSAHGRGGARGLRPSWWTSALFPCLNWRRRRDLWSVKHGRAGMNVQILVRLDGGFMWASDPYPGSMHDVAALDASGLLEGMDPSGWIGNKGYVGRGVITPHKKPPDGEPGEAAKEENKSVNRIRQVVE